MVIGTYGTNRAGGTCAPSRTACGVAIMLVLRCAGAGLGAQPTATGPLPEATVLNDIDGQFFPLEAKNAWGFELMADVQSDGRRLGAGTRLRLLPCAVLERLIADVNDRYTPRYRLSARVSQYEGTNYLLPTYFLPLSKFRGDGAAPDTGPAAQGEKPTRETILPPSDPELTIPPEIIAKLKDRPPLRGPLRKPTDSRTVTRLDRPPDRMLVNQVGRIEAESVEASERTGTEPPPQARFHAFTLPRFYFIPYALGWNVSPVRYELLPCSVLERVREMQRRSMQPLRFNVAGLVTEFQGRQYLLLQRATPVYNYGNFGR